MSKAKRASDCDLTALPVLVIGSTVKPDTATGRTMMGMKMNAERIDWYERRSELEPGMVFSSDYGIVKLDQRVEGDATQWVVLSWYAGRPEVKGYEQGHWSADDATIEPGDLIYRMPDDYSGLAA